MTVDLVHHPDCAWWYDQDAKSCQCGLTGQPAVGSLRPWTREAMEIWRATVNAEFRAIEERLKGKAS